MVSQASAICQRRYRPGGRVRGARADPRPAYDEARPTTIRLVGVAALAAGAALTKPFGVVAAVAVVGAISCAAAARRTEARLGRGRRRDRGRRRRSALGPGSRALSAAHASNSASRGATCGSSTCRACRERATSFRRPIGSQRSRAGVAHLGPDRRRLVRLALRQPGDRIRRGSGLAHRRFAIGLAAAAYAVGSARRTSAR